MTRAEVPSRTAGIDAADSPWGRAKTTTSASRAVLSGELSSNRASVLWSSAGCRSASRFPAWLREIARTEAIRGCDNSSRSASPPTYPAAPITSARRPSRSDTKALLNAAGECLGVATRVPRGDAKTLTDKTRADLVVGHRAGDD